MTQAVKAALKTKTPPIDRMTPGDLYAKYITETRTHGAVRIKMNKRSWIQLLNAGYKLDQPGRRFIFEDKIPYGILMIEDILA